MHRRSRLRQTIGGDGRAASMGGGRRNRICASRLAAELRARRASLSAILEITCGFSAHKRTAVCDAIGSGPGIHTRFLSRTVRSWRTSGPCQ